MQCIIRNVVGTYSSSIDTETPLSQALMSLFYGAVKLKTAFIALRGRDAFFETLTAKKWDDHISGEVSASDVRPLIDSMVTARRGVYNPDLDTWELTRLSKNGLWRWPRWVATTVSTAGQPKNLFGVMSQLAAVDCGNSAGMHSET